MNNLPFTKVEGIGNHFILVDTRQTGEMDWSALALCMCRHHVGVGADGLLVLGASSVADLSFRMFNPDGTEDMCGNGLRCAAVYARERGLICSRPLVFATKYGIRKAEVLPPEDSLPGARVEMGVPSLRPADMPMNVETDEVIRYPLVVSGETYELTCVYVGTPHAVICAPLESFWTAMPEVSTQIESHPLFPERVNVTWCAHYSSEELYVRTWERGVGPTLGCGTGACAALVAANLQGFAGRQACVTSPGGSLHIEWADTGELYMTGPTRIVFDGEWPLEGVGDA